jgi:hypothetical protein
METDIAGNVLLIASGQELPPERRVWGHGGWTSPEEREALDWLTLCRLLGWTIDVVRPGGPRFATAVRQPHRLILVGCAPEALSHLETDLLLRSVTDAAVLLITRLGGESTSLDAGTRSVAATGTHLEWQGPGPAKYWHLRATTALASITLAPDGVSWASLESISIIAARPIGRGMIATLGFQPSAARDLQGFFTALLRHLMIFGPASVTTWLNFENTLVLRMDDPGGAQNIHSRSWAYTKLGRRQWQEVTADLVSRGGRLSIGYVAGWVDDGDPARGSLHVDGRSVERKPGQVHPSALVEYHDIAGHRPGTVNDYVAEFAGIEDLRRAGAGDVELHGYTHMYPERAVWACAPDRYETKRWFREFGADAAPAIAQQPPAEHPLRLGIQAIEASYGTRPKTLIFPGDEWTEPSMEVALDLGIELVSSYYLALRYVGRFCWALHVCAPYLDKPSAEWFDSGLPVIGYFHDQDLATKGTSWMRHWLDRWTEAGARHFIDLRQLARRLQS